MKFIYGTLLLAFFYVSSAFAQNTVVVIPLGGEDAPSHCELHEGVLVDGECWILDPAGRSGNELCGYQDGYAGPYYAIGGGASADGCTGGEVSSPICPLVTGANTVTKAEKVSVALGLTLKSLEADCATNYTTDNGLTATGTSLSCWGNDARWSRNLGAPNASIVRCTNFE